MRESRKRVPFRILGLCVTSIVLMAFAIWSNEALMYPRYDGPAAVLSMVFALFGASLLSYRLASPGSVLLVGGLPGFLYLFSLPLFGRVSSPNLGIYLTETLVFILLPTVCGAVSGGTVRWIRSEAGVPRRRAVQYSLLTVLSAVLIGLSIYYHLITDRIAYAG